MVFAEINFKITPTAPLQFLREILTIFQSSDFGLFTPDTVDYDKKDHFSESGISVLVFSRFSFAQRVLILEFYRIVAMCALFSNL